MIKISLVMTNLLLALVSSLSAMEKQDGTLPKVSSVVNAQFKSYEKRSIAIDKYVESTKVYNDELNNHIKSWREVTRPSAVKEKDESSAEYWALVEFQMKYLRVDTTQDVNTIREFIKIYRSAIETINPTRECVAKESMFELGKTKEFFNAAFRQLNSQSFKAIRPEAYFAKHFEGVVNGLAIYIGCNVRWLNHNDMMKSHIRTYLDDKALLTLLETPTLQV